MPEPGPQPLTSVHWLMRTMAEDLARLGSVKKPEAKTLAAPETETKPPISEAIAPRPVLPVPPPAPPAAPPRPITPPPPRPQMPPPQVKTHVPAPAQVEVRPVGPKMPPPAPRPAKAVFTAPPVRDLILYIGVSVVTIAIGAALFAGLGRKPRAPLLTPTPLAIEGEVVIETPSPSGSPEPLVRSDGEEVITATADNLTAVLASVAAKPRPPAALVKLAFPTLQNEELAKIFGLQIPGLAAPQDLTLYLWTQQERFATTTMPSRMVAVGSLAREPLPEERAAFETRLSELTSALWLGNTAAGPAGTEYQDASYKGVAIRYLNFSWPDLSLDYATLPARNILLFATSREAMHAAIERLKL